VIASFGDAAAADSARVCGRAPQPRFRFAQCRLGLTDEIIFDRFRREISSYFLRNSYGRGQACGRRGGLRGKYRHRILDRLTDAVSVQAPRAFLAIYVNFQREIGFLIHTATPDHTAAE
jgi:hypothetical protein